LLLSREIESNLRDDKRHDIRASMHAVSVHSSYLYH